MVSQVSGAVVAALCRKVFERGKCRYSAPTDDASGTCRGVSLHRCPGLRCAEHRYGQGHIRQFLLWTGHRLHSVGGSIFGRQHLWWCVQPGCGCGHLLYRVIATAKYLDLSCRGFSWRCRGGGRLQGSKHDRHAWSSTSMAVWSWNAGPRLWRKVE